MKRLSFVFAFVAAVGMAADPVPEGAVDLTKPSKSGVNVISGSPCYSTALNWNTAFNDNLNDNGGRWLAKADSLPNVWLQYQFLDMAETDEDESSQLVTAYSFLPTTLAPTRSPKAWKLEGSNDGESWEMLDQRSNESDWIVSSKPVRHYYVCQRTSSTRYSHYRFTFSANNGATDYVNLVDVELYGPSASDVSVLVNGMPANFGVSVPAYGASSAEAGVTRHFSIVGSLVDDPVDGARCVAVSSGVRARYLGYSLVVDGQAAEGTDEEFDVTAQDSINVVWRFADQRLLTVVADAECGTCSIDDGAPAEMVRKWVTVGESAKMSATPAPGCSFALWEGVQGVGPVITVTPVAPMSVSARFGRRRHVSADGSDESGEGTAASPWRTITHAIRACADYDEICVAGGLYEESVTNAFAVESGSAVVPVVAGRTNLIIRGGYVSGTWERDLRGNPTVIRPRSNKVPCVYTYQAPIMTLDGLTLTGGSMGILAGGFDLPNLTAAELQQQRYVFTRLVVTNNAGAGVSIGYGFKNGKCAMLSMANCHVADNGGEGVQIWDNNSATCPSYFYNCTIVRNKGIGLVRWLPAAYALVKNSIIANNKGGGVQVGSSLDPDSAKRTLVSDSCVFGGTLGIVQNSGLHALVRPSGRVLSVDPSLGTDDVPAEGSRCLKQGEDLSADAAFAVADDIYGKARIGGADIGCFQTDLPRNGGELDVAFADEAGDDAASGASSGEAVRSASLACWLVRPGGTVRLGAGMYCGPLVPRGDNGRIEGAGRGKTVVTNKVNEVPLFVRGCGQSIAGLSVVGNGSIGVFVENYPTAYAVDIQNCEFASCSRGVWAMGHGEGETGLPEDFTNIVSHCVFTNCVVGLILERRDLSTNPRGHYVVANSLFASCSSYGYYDNLARNPPNRTYNCTFADNAYGCYVWAHTAPDGGRDRQFRNVFFADNDTAFYWASGKSVLDHCVFAGNKTVISKWASATGSTVTNSCVIAADPMFLQGRPPRLDVHSPACHAGVSLNGTAEIPCAVDLLGCVRTSGRWDAGCCKREVGLMLLIK